MKITQNLFYLLLYFCIQVSARFGGSESETSGTVESNCLSFDFQSAQCPARYNCRRLVTIDEVEEETKEFTATLICPGLLLPYTGTMKINGGFDVSYEDKFTPINCLYYSDNYNDRDDKQPYCDHCSSGDICESCEEGYYLIENGDRIECIHYYGCENYCEGTPDYSVDSEWQCRDPNVTLSECQNHLSGNTLP